MLEVEIIDIQIFKSLGWKNNMFVAIKDSKIIAIHESDWQCRLIAKGMTKPEYWKWLAPVKWYLDRPYIPLAST